MQTRGHIKWQVSDWTPLQTVLSCPDMLLARNNDEETKKIHVFYSVVLWEDSKLSVRLRLTHFLLRIC